MRFRWSTGLRFPCHVGICSLAFLAACSTEKNHPRASASATLANTPDYDGSDGQAECYDRPSGIHIGGTAAPDEVVTDGSNGATIACTIERSAGFKVGLDAVQQAQQTTMTSAGVADQTRVDHFHFEGTVDDSGQGSGMVDVSQKWSIVGSWGPYDNESLPPCELTVLEIGTDHITATFTCDQLGGTTRGGSACSATGALKFEKCE
jgi:hypothetical protein